MKKLISLALCLAMVLSIFAINASALVETGKTTISGGSAEVAYFNQQFDGTDATSFGATSAAEGINTVVDAADISSAADAITTGAYTFEFDIRKNAGYTHSSNGGFTLYFSRGGSDTTTGIRLFLSPHYLTEGTWYTYRFTIDDASYTGTDNAANQVTKVEYKEKSAAEFTTCTLRATSAPNSATTYRVRPIAAPADADITIRTVAGMNLSFDNIKAYTPAVAGVETTTPYPINEGNIVVTKTEETAIDPYAGAAVISSVNYTNAPTGRYLAITVDLNNTALGMPLSIAAPTNYSGAQNYAYADSIKSSSAILNNWYTYKIIKDSTVKNATAIYRRPAAGGAWTLLEAGTDYIADGSSRFTSHSKDKTNIRLGYLVALASNLADGATDATSTGWSYRNLQVVEGYAIAGDYELSGNALTFNFDVAAYTASAPIVAVYDGAKLVDVAYANLAATGEEATCTVDYAEGNTVMLYLWDSLTGGTPIMAEEATITIQ